MSFNRYGEGDMSDVCTSVPSLIADSAARLRNVEQAHRLLLILDTNLLSSILYLLDHVDLIFAWSRASQTCQTFPKSVYSSLVPLDRPSSIGEE